MNQDVRDILIISEYIAPVQTIASIRWTKLAKYLFLAGRYRVSVLTSDKDFVGDRQPGNHYLRDPLLENDLTYFDRYFVVPQTRALRRLYQVKQKTAGFQNAQSGASASPGRAGLFLPVKRTILELASACKDYIQRKAAERFIDSCPELKKYDVVISSYGPAWPHWAARKMKREKPAMVWIADYRDPYYRQGMPGALRRKYRRFASQKTGEANRITAVSEGMLPLLYLSSTQRATVVPNGFDRLEGRLPKSPSCFSLFYTGILYHQGVRYQNLTPVFAAVKALIDEGCIQEEDISLQYAGSTGDLFMGQASACGLAGSVQNLGLISRDAVTERRQEAAILLLATWNTHLEQGIVTGKIYEYMLSQKPILAVCSGDMPGSKVKEIISSGALGLCYEEPAGDKGRSELKQWLRDMYLSWKASGSLPFSPNEEYIQQFEYGQIAAKVDQIIDEETRNHV